MREIDELASIDAWWMLQLQSLEKAVRAGQADLALRQAGELFESLPPAWRLSELCGLTAEAAQALRLSELAEQMWREAASHATRPDLAASSQANLSALLSSLGRKDEARSACRRALELDPDQVEAMANLAVLLAAQGNYEEAEQFHRRALQRDPARAGTHSNLGVLLARTRRPVQAEHHYRLALELAPRSASAHTNLGLLLEADGRLTQALEHQHEALDLAPGSAEVHSNLGNLLARLDRFEEAEALLRRALVIDPEWPAAHTNLGVLLAELGRDEEAEVRLRRALSLAPGHAFARLDLSCLLLAQGRYEEGWALHEARYDPTLPDKGIPPPPLDLPMWQGESLAGKRLLVWPEQGLGDQIQFCRFVPRLKQAGAAWITLVCQGPLKALFETLPGADAVIAAEVVDNTFVIDPSTLAAHDCWTFPLSIPARLGTKVENLPEWPLPYLSAPLDQATRWRARLPPKAGRKRVGLVWRGNPKHHNDADRSIPGLDSLAPLWDIPGIDFVSLQFGSKGESARSAPAAGALDHLGDELADFADTAGALAAIDLLVCVDTSIAHLAGAMGRPCWVLLPHHRTDWRWLRGRDDSPWYPGTMRLFRQRSRGDWPGAIEQVKLELSRWVSPA